MDPNDEPVPLPAPLTPGSTIRFFVEAPDGRRSNTWRVWGSPNGSDIYIADRTTVKTFKTSLHPTVTTFGLTTEGANSKGYPVKDRTFSRLQGHPGRVPGWTVPCIVVFPVEHLQVLDSKDKLGTVVIPTAVGHDGVVVEIWVQDVKARPFIMEILHVASMDLPDKRKIHVLAHHVDLPWDPSVEFQQSIAEMRDAAKAKNLPPETPLRATVFGEDPDTNTQIHVELNADLGSSAE